MSNRTYGKRMMRQVMVLLLLGVGLLAAGLEERLQEAETQYLAGLQADQDGDRAKALECYGQAAKIYEEALAVEGFDNARLRGNLANAYLGQKKLGLAIFQYRKALRLEPDNANLAANLEIARNQCKDALTGQEGDRVLKTLFAFHYDIGLGVRRIIFHIAYGVFFVTLTVRLMLRRGHAAFTSIMAVAGVVAAVFGMSLLVSLRSQSDIHGVITAGVVHAKAGASNSYQDAFEAPLHDGTEFELERVDETRGWLHIRLRNGIDCWIPADTAVIDKR